MAGRGRAPVRLSPEFIEALRHRYVETDQPVRDIIAEFGISTGRLGRLIEKEGWPKRQDRPPLQLPPALKLLEETRALSIAFPARDAACNAASQTRGPGSPDQTGGPGLQRTTKACRAAPGTQPDEARPHTDSDPVARIEALVLKEIAAEETVRARLGGAPRPAADAGRGARTLAILTQTLQNLQRLRAAGRSAANPILEKMTSMTTCLPTSMSSVASLRAALRRSSRASRTTKMLRTIAPRWWRRLDRDFIALAHRHQVPPGAANNGAPWTTWLVLGGRGAGKTRLGAEWVRAQANGHSPYAPSGCGRIALVGETEHDAREVMVEGPAGLLAVSPPGERPRWSSSRRRLEWPNGAVAETFSAEDPEQLRGPQFDAAWCDELAKWKNPDAAFDMLQFGLRLGPRPRQLITTTPRPIALLKRLVADPRAAVTRAPTQANAAHLSPRFLDEVLARYAGTRLARQEIDGEIIEDRADALWSRATVEAARVAGADKFTQSAQTNGAPELVRIVVAVDPPASSREGADACGIVAAGRAADGTVYVLDDASCVGLAPAAWAARAIAVYRRLQADAIVAEVNQGGEMVKAVLRTVDAAVPIKTVHATRGKFLRAEPVAALYAQGRVRHVRGFAELEDEMCDFGVDGLSSGRSPDRLDALVWAVTELTTSVRRGPRVWIG
jgi:phage terminase large subunit-like protein